MDDFFFWSVVVVGVAPFYLALGALTSGLMARNFLWYKEMLYNNDAKGFTDAEEGFWVLVWPFWAVFLVLFLFGASVIYSIAFVGSYVGKPTAKMIAGDLTDAEREKIKENARRPTYDF